MGGWGVVEELDGDLVGAGRDGAVGADSRRVGLELLDVGYHLREQRRLVHLVGAGDHAPERGEVRVDPLPPPPLRLAVAPQCRRRLLLGLTSSSLPLLHVHGRVQLPRPTVQQGRRRRRPQLAESVAAAETAVEPVIEPTGVHVVSGDSPEGQRL